MSETRDITSPLREQIKALPYCQAHRLHSGQLRVRGGWLHGEDKGTPDVLALIGDGSGPPLAVYFETKTTTGVVSDAQRAEHDRLRRNGSLVFVVRSVAAAMTEVRRLLALSGPRLALLPDVQFATGGSVSNPLGGDVASSGGSAANESGRVAATNSARPVTANPGKEKRGARCKV